MYIAPSSGHTSFNFNMPFKLILIKEMWGCFLMSGVKILHFLKDWWKSIPIHQNYTMALNLNWTELLFQFSFLPTQNSGHSVNGQYFQIKVVKWILPLLPYLTPTITDTDFWAHKGRNPNCHLLLFWLLPSLIQKFIFCQSLSSVSFEVHITYTSQILLSHVWLSNWLWTHWFIMDMIGSNW